MSEKQLIYRTFFGRIDVFEVGKPSTESFVFPIINGETARCRRISNGVAYFDTWQEAKDHLVAEAEAGTVSVHLILRMRAGMYRDGRNHSEERSLT